MANRPAYMTQEDANRLFKAAKAAGYERTRIISWPDGRREVIVEVIKPADTERLANPWDEVHDETS